MGTRCEMLHWQIFFSCCFGEIVVALELWAGKVTEYSEFNRVFYRSLEDMSAERNRWGLA